MTLIGCFVNGKSVHFKVILKFWMRGPTRGSDNKKKLDGRVVVITGEVVQLEGVIFMRKHNKKTVFFHRSSLFYG